MKRKRLRYSQRAKHPQLEKELKEWVLQTARRSLPRTCTLDCADFFLMEDDERKEGDMSDSDGSGESDEIHESEEESDESENEARVVASDDSFESETEESE